MKTTIDPKLFYEEMPYAMSKAFLVYMIKYNKKYTKTQDVINNFDELFENFLKTKN